MAIGSKACDLFAAGLPAWTRRYRTEGTGKLSPQGLGMGATMLTDVCRSIAGESAHPVRSLGESHPF